MEKTSQCFFLKSHTGDKAVCPDGLFVPAKMSSVCFYLEFKQSYMYHTYHMVHQKQHHVPYSLAILINGTFLLIHQIASMRWAFQCVF